MKPALLLVTVGLPAASLVRPLYPHGQTLQHIPTVAAIGLPACDVRGRRLSIGAFACCATFLWLHILGARYIYSYVPYEAWAETLGGAQLASPFVIWRDRAARVTASESRGR